MKIASIFIQLQLPFFFFFFFLQFTKSWMWRCYLHVQLWMTKMSNVTCSPPPACLFSQRKDSVRMLTYHLQMAHLLMSSPCSLPSDLTNCWEFGAGADRSIDRWEGETQRCIRCNSVVKGCSWHNLGEAHMHVVFLFRFRCQCFRVSLCVKRSSISCATVITAGSHVFSDSKWLKREACHAWRGLPQQCRNVFGQIYREQKVMECHRFSKPVYIFIEVCIDRVQLDPIGIWGL